TFLFFSLTCYSNCASMHRVIPPKCYPSCSIHAFVFSMFPPPPRSTLFPYTTLFRSPWCSPRWASGRSCWSAARTSASAPATPGRSEEHTSELQSRENLVCRLLLEKKNAIIRSKENPQYHHTLTTPKFNNLCYDDEHA